MSSATIIVTVEPYGRVQIYTARPRDNADRMRIALHSELDERATQRFDDFRNARNNDHVAFTFRVAWDDDCFRGDFADAAAFEHDDRDWSASCLSPSENHVVGEDPDGTEIFGGDTLGKNGTLADALAFLLETYEEECVEMGKKPSALLDRVAPLPARNDSEAP